MRKFVSFIACIALLFTLAACDAANQPPKTGNNVPAKIPAAASVSSSVPASSDPPLDKLSTNLISLPYGDFTIKFSEDFRYDHSGVDTVYLYFEDDSFIMISKYETTMPELDLSETKEISLVMEDSFENDFDSVSFSEPEPKSYSGVSGYFASFVLMGGNENYNYLDLFVDTFYFYSNGEIYAMGLSSIASNYDTKFEYYEQVLNSVVKISDATSIPASSSPAPQPSESQPIFTAEQTQAIRSAEDYLSFMAFSRQGLIEQLEYEGFSNEDATIAVDSLTVDWNVAAAAVAQNYLDTMGFSRQGLIEQLEYEGFTTEQATFGVDIITVDWNEQAAVSAQNYLDTMAFSRQGLIDQLVYEGFTLEQATYGVDAVGL